MGRPLSGDGHVPVFRSQPGVTDEKILALLDVRVPHDKLGQCCFTAA